MSFPTRAHTFVSGDTLTASQLNTEFDIAINALAAGTKDANIVALTATTLAVSTTTDFTGNVNANANVNIGDASSDTLKVNASSVFNNAVTINAASSFNAAVTLNAAANITGNANISGNVNAAGNVVIGGTLGVTGITTLTANIAGSPNVTGTLTAGNIATAGTMISTGNATAGNISTAGIISATGTGTFGNVSTAGSLTIGSIAATSANIVAAARTRATGTSVGTGGVAISSDTGSTTTHSGNDDSINNASVTITTSGRPVLITFVPSSTTLSELLIGKNDTSSVSSISGTIFIKRGGVALAAYTLILGFPTDTSSQHSLSIPVSSVMHVDAVTAGTYTYTATFQSAAANSQKINVLNAFLVAYEL